MNKSALLTAVGKRIGSWLVRLLIVVLVLGTPVVLFLYLGQHSMIYHPRPYSSNYARLAGFDGIEIPYQVKAGAQTAYFVPAKKGPPRRLWVAFCGNGSLALDWMGLLQGYPRDDEAFLLVDYPGYGKNAGYATIAGTRESAEAALRALSIRVGFDEHAVSLAVLGHSLGAAAALDFAAHHHVSRIVAISPFTTLREEAARVVGGLLSRLVTDNYDNRASLRAIFAENPNEQVAMFHGIQDDVIPEQMGAALAREFPRIKFFPVAGGDHVTVLELARAQIIASMTKPD
jgi:uncharacterized protein